MSSRSLDSLRPEFRPLVDEFLAACTRAQIEIIVTCTLRTEEEQTALYAQGRSMPGHIVTNAKAGQSAHQYGLAIDVVPMVNGKPDWVGTDPLWAEVGAIGQAAGLEWLGAPGSPFIEEAHFQLKDWKDVASLT